jgi:hypothetical protein
MPPFYQTYLQGQLSRAEYLLLVCLLSLLQSMKQVRLETLATQLPLPIEFESRRRKLQRFLSLPQLNFRSLWFPLLRQWVEQQFSHQQRLYLAMDRTSWARVNLLVVSLVYDKRAIPVYVRWLDKLGSSNLDEQKKYCVRCSTC